MKSSAPVLVGLLFAILLGAATAGPGDPTNIYCAGSADDATCNTLCASLVAPGTPVPTGCCVSTGPSTAGYCTCCDMMTDSNLGITTAGTCANVRSGCKCNCVIPKRTFTPCVPSGREMSVLREHAGYNNTLLFNTLFGDYSF